MPVFDLLVLFIFGTIIGSFLNALSFRYNTGRSMWGRSACTSCGVPLRVRDLVPVLSYLGLRGRCGACRTKISFQYPLVEILGGLLAVLSYHAALGSAAFSYHDPLSSAALFVGIFTFFSLLLFIAVYDIRHTIIPDSFVVLSGLVGLLSVYLLSGSVGIVWALMSGLVLAAPLALLWLLSKGRLIGLGDAKLFLVCGIFLGIEAGLASFLFSFWIGAIASLLYLAYARLSAGKARVTMKSEVPFGPFIIFSVAIVYFARIDIYDVLSTISF